MVNDFPSMSVAFNNVLKHPPNYAKHTAKQFLMGAMMVVFNEWGWGMCVTFRRNILPYWEIVFKFESCLEKS